MILYLDTSALIKLYFKEEFTPLVQSLLRKAEVVASHVITFVETHATFARLQRENKLAEPELVEVKKEFVTDWDNFFQIDTMPTLLQTAANYAEAFALRAYDSVHLAAAENLQKSSNESIVFACFDKKLNLAAKVLGMSLLDVK